MQDFFFENAHFFIKETRLVFLFIFCHTLPWDLRDLADKVLITVALEDGQHEFASLKSF